MSMSLMFRGKAIFKPLNTGWIDDHVACVREWIANIFFYTKDGVLKGYILIGDTGRAGIYTSLVRERVPLDSIDFELTKKTASNFIFSKETRRKKFGGVV